MAWKQDLAKLKQQLGPEEAAPAPKPLPKPVPRPERPASLDDEDAVFLSAMGLKPKPAPSRPAPEEASGEAPPEAPPASPGTRQASAAEPPAPETFEEALKDLKGLKPLPRGPQGKPKQTAAKTPAAKPALEPPAAKPALEPLAAQPAPEPPAAKSAPEAVPVSAPPIPAPLPASPVRFQLAAGMALEVDGSLDLRGHSPEDAVERLKDRLGDGQVLGWRSLQVLLGPDPKLHEALMALLASGETPMLARYAQAPVPMGGNQAWLLYFTASTAQS